MKVQITTLFLAAFAVLSVPQEGFSQEACNVYRVVPGDSLRDITDRAYGHDDYRELYQFNRDEIGRNPNIIEVGMILKVPCADGSFPDLDSASIALTPGGEGVVSFVTANGYLPYTDESLEGQGIFTTLVERAMMRSGTTQKHTVTFVNDWAAHLEALLPTLAFDASFPWTKPRCETPGALTSFDQGLCETYVYSEPFYEIVEGFFARTGTGYEELLDAEDFKTARFCRPEGYPTGHFADLGIWPAEDQIVYPTGVATCFELLMDGKVDVVSVDTRSGAHVLRALGLDGSVSENLNVSSIVPLQVAVHKENPDAKMIIEQLNLGLRQMHESGEWHAVISDALQAEVKAGGAVMN